VQSSWKGYVFFFVSSFPYLQPFGQVWYHLVSFFAHHILPFISTASNITSI